MTKPYAEIHWQSLDALRAAPAVMLDLSENPFLRQLLVADRGHVPLLDEPECLAAIDDFLTQLR
jgi:hypothetical protein